MQSPVPAQGIEPRLVLRRGRHTARLAASETDVQAAQRLRQRCFRGGAEGLDADAHDRLCHHVLVEDADGTLLSCCRVLLLPNGQSIGQSYSAQFYDLSGLARWPTPMLEIGRFCILPGRQDPEILRIGWAALTRIVDDCGVGLMFGCSSFTGADPARHAEALAHLAVAHLAPVEWAPGRKAGETVGLAGLHPAPDAKRAMLALPSLLRTYLIMGGWVSDHAVLDRDLDTLHVFTGVEIAAIPPARARLLRAVAESA